MSKYFLLFFILTLYIYSDNFNITDNIKSDYKNYYLKSDYKKTFSFFFLGAIMANSKLDQNLTDFYNERFHNHQSDLDASRWKLGGEGKLVIPFALAASSLNLVGKNPVGDWGSFVIRSYLVGAPPMLLMQKVTGGSRPLETEHSSQWRFFNDDNGVSGHSFIGAVPFLVASRMVENKVAADILFALSTFTAVSRVNDNAHFTSQAILGWYMGYLAVDAVDKTNKSETTDFILIPMIGENQFGILISNTF